MPADNLGAHMSIAGGLPEALVRGRELGCSVIQLFLKNQRQWAGRPLHADEVAEFVRQQAATQIRTAFAHATYLINLASPSDPEWGRSVDAFFDELERAERLGLPFVVIHPGSHLGAGPAAGVARLARALDELHARTAGYRVRVALENAAGAGNCLGCRAEELAAVLGAIREPERLAVCLDTCHLFAAGYDLRTPAGFAATLAAFDRAIGLERVVAFHLNDAQAPLGSGLDRHEHIGRGRIGLGAFRRLLRHPVLSERPMVLETPKVGTWDQRNLATLRRLARRPARAAVRASGRRRAERDR
jgi:deoxyribonuclease-4